ncbi:hypothetical protein FZEAL_2514 [Fusarium zealandicum]|uniref:Uncharacterized protein n=1 Tax=Fusarium zealandicum TaxID=1053134 RepID=A0A8H4UQL1_9HYPO|nr:hypothetical protein FZEAL_2514 [Fusarium zealandicum]
MFKERRSSSSETRGTCGCLPGSRPCSTYGWLSEALRWPSLLAFSILDIALASAIIALSIISAKHDGFVTVLSQNITSTGSIGLAGADPIDFNISLDLGVLWTSLPSFVFALFGAYWAWISGAISERQPYVDLRKEHGASAKTTVLLDYGAVPVLWRWWGAFRKSHLTVGSTTLLSVLLTYGVAPFAARLFVPQVVVVPAALPITFNTTFDENSINATLDWRPVLDTVAATLLYQGNNIPWTDHEHAFRPFSTKSRAVVGGHMGANTTAYAAYLNCKLVDDYTITADSKTVEVGGDDRGCSFKQSFDVVSTQKVYFKTTVEMDCSAQAYYSRLVFTAAKYSSSAENNLDEISVISCATGYRQTAGTLRVSSSIDAPVIQSFVETGQPDTSRPKLWRVFEQSILGPVSFNPQAEWSTSDMGSLILYHAQRSQPSSPLASDTLMDAISDVFTAIYLNAVAIYGFTSLSVPESGTGESFNPTTRLFVVSWVAYIIIAFLFIVLCSAVLVFVQVQKSPSILSEDPEGLLSMAAILENSELLQIASEIRQEMGPDGDGAIRKRGEARSDVKDRKWGAIRSPETDNWVINSIQDN